MIKSVFFFFSGFISRSQKGKIAIFCGIQPVFRPGICNILFFAGIWKNKENIGKTENFLKLSWRGTYTAEPHSGACVGIYAFTDRDVRQMQGLFGHGRAV